MSPSETTSVKILGPWPAFPPKIISHLILTIIPSKEGNLFKVIAIWEFMKKRTLINFHIHSTGSDGKLTPEEVVKEAIRAGISYMCFTDHYKQPDHIDPKWNTDGFHSEIYVKEVKRLQKEYQSKINISFGAEFDWLENYRAWTINEIKKQKYDYLIGSVHLLYHPERYHSLDNGKDGKNKWLDSAKHFGDVENIVKEYYKQVRLMAKSGLFDSIGHFDVIKLYNKDPSLFLEDSDWYRQEIGKTLDEVAKARMAIEINIRGFYKTIGIQYPSFWILQEARKRNIPITIGTDAHSAGQVNQDLDRAYDIARQAGYSEIVRFKARKMIPVKI